MNKIDKQLCLLKTGYIYSTLLLFYAGLQSLLEGVVSIGIVEYLASIPLIVTLYKLMNNY